MEITKVLLIFQILRSFDSVYKFHILNKSRILKNLFDFFLPFGPVMMSAKSFLLASNIAVRQLIALCSKQNEQVTLSYEASNPKIGNKSYLISGCLKTPEQGAKTGIYLAVSPEVKGQSGGYYVNCRLNATSRTAR